MYINMKDFGAAGNGIADDTAVFNAALAAVSAGGGLLDLGPGNFKISTNLATISGKSNVTIRGAGMGVTKITRTAPPSSGTNFGLFSVSGGSHWTLRDMTLVGAGPDIAVNTQYNGAAKGTYFTQVSDLLIERVEALNMEGESIYCDGDAARGAFRNCVVRSSCGAAYNLNSSRTTSEAFTIEGNLAIGGANGCIQATGKFVSIRGNRVSNPTPSGCDLILIANCANFLCEGNFVFDSDLSAATVSPIHVWVNDGVAVQGLLVGNFIDKCKTSNRSENQGGGIFIDNAPGVVSVLGNTVCDTGQASLVGGHPGVRVGGANTGQVTIQGNSFHRVDTATYNLQVGVAIDSAVPTNNNVTVGPNLYNVPVPFYFGAAPSQTGIASC